MPDFRESARRIRFWGGNILRFLSPWRSQALAIQDARTIFGAAFDASGWHHLRQTLAEVDARPGIDIRDTTLHRFLTEFCPPTFSLLLPPTVVDRPLPLFVYPWGTLAANKDAAKSRFCGPSSDGFVAEEFKRTMALYRQLKSTGYRPFRYPNSFISGTWLIANDGRKRFIVLQGNHRLAILAHIGVQDLTVRPVPGAIKEVRESEFSHWPLVRSGQCSPEHALAAFRLFFENDGHHLAALLPRHAHK